MQRRLIVTGGTGFVAGSILKAATVEWDVHVLSRATSTPVRGPWTWHSANGFEAAELDVLFDEIRPDAVIHAAAIANIDYCLGHPSEAVEVNTLLTQSIAEHCAERRIRLVYISTDNVFDGKAGRYSESDTVCPVNVYGETKVAAEKAVEKLVQNSVIARLALVVGLPVHGEGHSLLSHMIPALEAGERVGVPESEMRSPIDVITAGAALVELANHEFTGVINLAGDDIMNRLEMAQRIASTLGLDSNLLYARDPSDIPGRDVRPTDVSLLNAKIREVCTTPMVGLEDGIRLSVQAR